MSNTPFLYPYARLGTPTPDERSLVNEMLKHYPFSQEETQSIQHRASRWVRQLRETPASFMALEQLMHEYPITSDEGLALMQLAESLLRVPDAATADILIRDKLHNHSWLEHTTPQHSLLGKASGWCAWLAEKIISTQSQYTLLQSLLQRLGEPTVRHAVLAAIEHLGHQFVLGKNIEEALNRATHHPHPQIRYSFDSLGEGARTASDAQNYFEAYRHALHVLGERQEGDRIDLGSSISIKLSALHPRYEWLHYPTVMDELYPRLLILAQEARYYQIGLTLDAEESDRLELSLHLLEKLLADPSLAGWNQLGIAIQAYGKRVLPLIDHLIHLTTQYKTQLSVRLVKGAYWDSEIKQAQERGLENYPVFTEKSHTDLSYLVAAKKLLDARPQLFPQFATHNALTLSQILELANHTEGFELQRLHGMGIPLYEKVQSEYPVNCRIYAPVGTYSDLLAYLVRRMLENGANSSFVYQLTDPSLTIDSLCLDTKQKILAEQAQTSRRPLHNPSDLFGTERKNSQGLHLQHPDTLNDIRTALLPRESNAEAYSLINGQPCSEYSSAIYSPNDTSFYVGSAHFIEQESTVSETFTIAHKAHPAWNRTSVENRAAALEKMADLLEERREDLLYLLCHEAGKTIQDSLDEIRESVDFCRYYAQQARLLFGSQGIALPSPTGESNHLTLHGRGIWLCISPWNFPLAIFLGQVVAALVSGNCVIAKPAEQTPLIAHLACQLLYESGIPTDVLQLILGIGKHLSDPLLSAPSLSGVAFTGSIQTARLINQKLAERSGAIIPLIAETGGQNTMIVDSTALLEHACDAVIQSAFKSAGQRCSALRILFIQEDIANPFIKMLTGAMKELSIGASYHPATNVGPLIDEAAHDRIQKHLDYLEQQEARTLCKLELPESCTDGHFISPHLIEIKNIALLKEEVFGPILHLIRYRAGEWHDLLGKIHQLGYGLTLGLQTRIQERIDEITQRAEIGNIYVNRSMTGAVVGSQPFGGEKLSGTGPKAGGPHYLLRFAAERTVTINLTAAAGNPTLLGRQPF